MFREGKNSLEAEKRVEALLTLERTNDWLKKRGWKLQDLPTSSGNDHFEYFKVLDENNSPVGVHFKVDKGNPSEGAWHYLVDMSAFDEAYSGDGIYPYGAKTLEDALNQAISQDV